MKPPIVFALLLSACSPPTSDKAENTLQAEQDPEIEFSKAVGNDPWANWPADLSHFGGEEHSCVRVTEQSREPAIRLLAMDAAIHIDVEKYKELTGKSAPQSQGALFLLRGFSTSNSAARVTVNGAAVTVHSDALAGVYNIRRDPCVAALQSAPSTVYTVVAYDL